VRHFYCMGLCRDRPVWAGQTAVDGAKGGLGPPPGVMWQLGWAVVRVYQGGAAQHTHPLVVGQVWVAAWWQDEVVGMQGRWWDGGHTSGRSPAWSSIPSPRPGLGISTGGGGVQQQGGGGQCGECAKRAGPQNHPPPHHTHLINRDHRVSPPRGRCRRAALGVWWPPQCPCACRRRAVGSDRATSRRPRDGARAYTGYVQRYCGS